jgi:hypothetical protein
MRTASSFVRIGQIGVDAGLVWLGDPCYIDSNDTPPFDNWPRFCEQVEGVTHRQFKEGMAVSPAHGDGVYHVYAVMDGPSIRGVLIDFDGLIEDME